MIRDYYDLEVGFLIDRHLELLKVCSNPEVYISRKSLKHFVESRKAELQIRYEQKEVIRRLFFLIDAVERIMNGYDEEEIRDSGRYIRTKYFYINRSAVRVVLDKKPRHWEIVSIHFQKTKKLP